MRLNYIYIIIIFLGLLTGCDDNTYPRPRGYVRLYYPEAKYNIYRSDELHIQFEKSHYADVELKRENWINLIYPKMKATIHLTYMDIDNNTNELINEIHKLTDKHKVKASGIIPHMYSNPEEKVYGVLYEVIGNSASNLQFYATDSTKHIVSGALYFYTSPNPDSLAPAISYIKNDVIMLLESLKWNDTKGTVFEK